MQPLLLLIYFLCVTSAMKRKFQDDAVTEKEAKEPLFKRSKIEEITEVVAPAESFSLDNYPEDVILDIALKLLEGYPLRPKCSNPFGYLNVLSKKCNEILGGPLIQEQIRKIPNSALHILTKERFQGLGLKHNFDLLQITAPLLKKGERFNAMMVADDLSALGLLSDLSPFKCKCPRVYKRTRKFLDSQMAEAYPNFNKERKDIFRPEGKLEAFDDFFLFKVPIETIVKRCFLDDFHAPMEYTWIFYAISNTFCHIYFNDHRHLDKLIEWRNKISGINLPFTKFNLLAEAMTWPMFLAFLVEDWAFLELLDLNYTTLKKCATSGAILARTIMKCVANRCIQLPDKVIPHLEVVCVAQAESGYMGFDKAAVQTALLDILQRFGDRNARAAIEELILEQ